MRNNALTVWALSLAGAIILLVSGPADSSYTPRSFTISVSGGSMTLPSSGAPDNNSNAATEGTNSVVMEAGFDAASTECAYVDFMIPEEWNGGNVEFCPHWYSAAATTGDARWLEDYVIIGDSDDGDSAFANERTFTVTTDGTAGDMSNTCNSAFTLTSANAGKDMHAKFCRVGGSTLDTLAGDAQLKRLIIHGYQ